MTVQSTDPFVGYEYPQAYHLSSSLNYNWDVATLEWIKATSSAGGTQYTEDVAAAADPVGTMPMFVRADTPAGIVTTDGDNVGQRGTNYGASYVTLLDTSGNPVSVGGGTQYTEDAAAAANPVGTALNMVRDDARSGGITTTDGDNIAARGTNAGELYVKHVDSIPVTDNAGSLTVDNAALSVTGGGVEATALRVTIASDSTGVLSVDDNGGALTVDGTVTANAGTNLNTSALALEAGGNLAAAATSLAILDDWDETDRAKVNLIVGQAGIAAGTGVDGATVPRVTLATNVALPAGDNNIGNVDIVSGTVTTVSTVTSLTQMNGQAISMNTGVRDAGTQRVTIATNDVVPVTDNAGSLTVDAPVGTPVNVQIGNATLSAGVIDETAASAVDALAIGGGTAHDAVDSGNPIKIGGVAVSGSASPTSVAAADRVRFIANQHGIPYMLGGHPNLITREYDFGVTAQTDTNLAAAVVAADERCYVTRFEAMCDNANTVAVSVRAGFGAANVPTASATGVSGMIGSHPGVAAGSGFVCGNGAGIIGVGAAGEEPRLTSTAATTGNLHVIISYFIIDETP